MYQYSLTDQRLIESRVAEYRGQTARFLSGDLNEDQFKPLRLMNGLYIERQAPMLRVAIPYGELSSRQLFKLADIAKKYDRGYGHFTTRQNIQFNWPRLEQTPDILADLASVQMHAIQSSGNCIRNITSDHLAGLLADEVADPRPYCEIVRQWANLHPEFAYLPRKFKIAVSGSQHDRAASQVHDIGLHLVRNEANELGFEVLVGGGLGRTPVIGKQLRAFLPRADILSYLEAILRVYNLNGRRDNKYKARIKILVNSMGIDAFRKAVEEEWEFVDRDALRVSDERIERITQQFAPPEFDEHPAGRDLLLKQTLTEPGFARWLERNTLNTRFPGIRAVFVSLKAQGIAPGDITADQMDEVADLARLYGHDQARATHTQNLLLPFVAEDDLKTVWTRLDEACLATPNIATVNDIICCPGLEFCSLANAESIPVALAIQEHFEDLDEAYGLGDIQIKISGCMNACGHHHVGHIGILGVDKKGEQWYQLTLGGSADENTRLGDRLGPAIAHDKVADIVARIINFYVRERLAGESFLQTYSRLGVQGFREAVYD